MITNVASRLLTCIAHLAVTAATRFESVACDGHSLLLQQWGATVFTRLAHGDGIWLISVCDREQLFALAFERSADRRSLRERSCHSRIGLLSASTFRILSLVSI